MRDEHENRKMAVDVIEVTVEEMEALIARVESALNDGLSLEADDIRLILQVLRQFAYQQERLGDNETLRQRYLKLMGLVSSSETQDKLFNREAQNDSDNSDDNQRKNKKKPPRPKRNQRKKNTTPREPKVLHHAITDLVKGQLCPTCEAGRLYKFDPATFIRIVGHAPLEAQKHICEQLRCHLCGGLFTAPLPEEVSKDGARGQKYGYSARAVMSIYKFFAGNPYYRQENLQGLMGVPVSASTVYDQCALLADDLRAIWLMLIVIGANAVHFHLDDTRNRILDQKPVEKPNRNGKGSRMRSGVYTSGVIATLDNGEDIVLFKTNIGHAGEWIDEILAHRDPALPAPMLMSDALSSNEPTKTDCQRSLCNVHSRRQFTDVAHNFPQEVEYVVDRYAVIWQNETEVKRLGLNDAQRLDYHREHSLPVMEELKRWCEQKLDAEQWSEHSGLGKAIKYYLKHFLRLTAFCRIVGAKIDNNLMEMVLRLIVLNRKNSYFFRTQAGAEVGDILTSLIATCELNGVDLFDYLVVVQQHRLESSRHPEQWLPSNYRKTLERLAAMAA